MAQKMKKKEESENFHVRFFFIFVECHTLRKCQVHISAYIQTLLLFPKIAKLEKIVIKCHKCVKFFFILLTETLVLEVVNAKTVPTALFLVTTLMDPERLMFGVTLRAAPLFNKTCWLLFPLDDLDLSSYPE